MDEGRELSAVAHVAVFLLSGESGYVTGQTLLVDGGLHGFTTA